MGYIRQGMGGGGAALEASGLKILQSTLDEARQVRLQELHAQSQRELQQSSQSHAERMERDIRQPFQREQQERGFEHAEDMQSNAFTHAAGMQEAGFIHSEEQQGRAFEHAENLARINRAHAETLANMGAQLLPDPQSGKIAVVGKNGEFKSWLTDKEGNTITGAKDLSAATKAYVDTIRDRLKALDKEETTLGLAPEQQQTLASRRAALNNDLLGALTTGKVPEQSKPSARSIVDPFAARSGGGERQSRPAAGASQYDEEGNLREPPAERQTVRRGAERRGTIRNLLEPQPELLNEE